MAKKQKCLLEQEIYDTSIMFFTLNNTSEAIEKCKELKQKFGLHDCKILRTPYNSHYGTYYFNLIG